MTILGRCKIDLNKTIETMKKQLDELFRNIDDAAVIIDKRNRLSEQRIREFIKGLSRR